MTGDESTARGGGGRWGEDLTGPLRGGPLSKREGSLMATTPACEQLQPPLIGAAAEAQRIFLLVIKFLDGDEIRA